jgi:dihydropteroate synthase
LKSYLRPLGLVYGADARQLIIAGSAGALGGMPQIGFTHVEIISRSGKGRNSRIEAFVDAIGRAGLRAICQPRPAFARLDMGSTRVMGIVNVTPDSFSDGGRHDSQDAGVAHGLKLLHEGADIIDVGGESTRPGSETVDIGDELARVLPVIAGLAKHGSVSIDTRKAEVMRQAVQAGAIAVNDVSALHHDELSAGVVADLHVPVILMHAQGEPKTMQLNPLYDDVVLDVYDALEARIDAAVAAGVSKNQIMIDPGIGFGKSYRHNLQVMQQMTVLHGLGVPVMIGLSRKAYVGAITAEKKPGERAAGSVGGALHAAMHAAHMLRVHDVKTTVDALKVFAATLDPDSVDI